ncbi:Nif3-like dinuclear metal center hexameric protein [Chloroflexi bacterium TSY]|nr:Nif3-like dinuclear metal center hexameric protein [Chloroflexi bacterium TSY]
MAKRTDIVAYLDDYLRISEIKDYGPQGLQIEGRDDIERIVGLVDAHQPCVDAALDRHADLMLVHHGIFWGPQKRLVGSYAKLVHSFMQASLNLYAAHLALDAHPEIGNNAELARRLGLDVIDWWGAVNGTNLAALCMAPEKMNVDELVVRFEKMVGPVKVVLAHGPKTVQRVGILSGSGANHIEDAAVLGCDTFLTGETSHAQYYDALNAGIKGWFILGGQLGLHFCKEKRCLYFLL